MLDFIASLLMFIGTLFCLLAAIGVVRMPDILLRMHSATKAGTLGMSCVLIATGIALGGYFVWIKVVLAIVFIFITGPMAAHLLGRAAYRIGLPLSNTTHIDEMKAAFLEEN